MDMPLFTFIMRANIFKKRPALGVFCLLVLVSLVLRLPYWNVPFPNWDESCFLVVGQDILRGHLPYEQAWCNKPPLGFFYFAALIALFGKNLAAIRAVHSIYIALSAFIIYLTGRSLHQTVAGLYAALFVIVLATFISAGQSIIMEHVALLPLTAIVYLFVKPPTLQRLVAMGVLVGIATLIRTNLGFVLPGLLLCIVCLARQPVLKIRIKQAFIVGAAALLPVAAMGLLYEFRGEFALFLIAMYKMPFAFVHAEASNLLQSIRRLQIIFYFAMYGHEGWLIFDACLAGAFFTTITKPNKHIIQIRMLVLTLFIFISIVATGAQYSHYLIQLLPFGSLPAGCFMKRILHEPKGRYSILLSIVIGASIAILMGKSIVDANPEEAPLYASAIDNFSAYVKNTNGPTTPDSLPFDRAVYQVADYLNAQQVEGKYIFSVDSPLIYYLTGALLPITEAHPALLSKIYMLRARNGEDYTFDRLIDEIFSKNPVYVVDINGRNSSLEDLIRAKLRESYEKTIVIGWYSIYKRKVQ